MADYKKEAEKIKKKTKKIDILSQGFNPIRMGAIAIENARRKKQRKKEIDALPMKVDDFQEDHELRKIKKRLNLAKGGVVPGRGGEFKGVR
jgi:hypothetical protein